MYVIIGMGAILNSAHQILIKAQHILSHTRNKKAPRTTSDKLMSHFVF